MSKPISSTNTLVIGTRLKHSVWQRAAGLGGSAGGEARVKESKFRAMETQW